MRDCVLTYTLTLARKMGVQLDNEHWYEHVPKLIEAKHEGKVIILWNQLLQTDRTIPTNKLDITIHDNEKGTHILIYAAISGDRNVIRK
jgi:hypothetical protein